MGFWPGISQTDKDKMDQMTTQAMLHPKKQASRFHSSTRMRFLRKRAPQDYHDTLKNVQNKYYRECAILPVKKSFF